MNEDFFSSLSNIQKILNGADAIADRLEAIEEYLRDIDLQREFFRVLDDTAWITPLKARGHFDNPPRVKQMEDGHTQFRVWPASKYLARMASQDPNNVSEIFSKIKTDNSSIIGDILDAALDMPVEVAISLVPVVCQAAKDGTLQLNFRKASDLCARLAEGDEEAQAMVLAEALFEPTFAEGCEGPGRREEYWYKDGIEKVMPVLAERNPCEFMPKLCEWLKALVAAKKHVGPESGSDFSYVWRPAIEEHKQNHGHNFLGALVGFVREGFEVAIRHNSLSFKEALEIIEGYSYLVFKRIRLHLIGEFSEHNPELACREILNPQFFDDYKYKHEYAMLVGKRLELLSPTELEQWYGWIDDGPDMSGYDETIRERTGKEATVQDRQDRIDYWKFEKLYWVREYLEGERKSFYDKILNKHGPPNFADMNSYIGRGSRRNDSPMTVEDFKGMEFAQVVDFVSLWQPEASRFVEPNIEGLSSTFANYLASNSVAFSAKAQVLKNRPAIFVRKYINQMSQDVKNGMKIDLLSVLDLCQWAVKQPVTKRTTPAQEDEMLVDKDWQWTRDEISRLIQNICDSKRDDKPTYDLDTFRELLWKLIESLCHDRTKSDIVRDISKDDPRVRDYLDLGINSPRGKAMEAALEYARWVANHVKQTDGKQEIVPDGFEAMSEVREMLEWQINHKNRSFEVLAIIGSQIGLIYWIDKQWLKENTETIFQLDGIGQNEFVAHGWAAWNAFLVWVSPHVEFYRLFSLQFAYAVEQAAKVESTKSNHRQPMQHLGEHLITLYGRGQLDLDKHNGIVKNFLINANPEFRRHAIGFVGQSLEGDEKVPPDVLARFEKLYDFYWSGPGKNDAKEKPDSYLFGTWFSCGQFPKQWALDRLEEFVIVAPTPEPNHTVFETLAKIAHVDVEKSVRILDLMVHDNQEYWRIHDGLDAAKTILKQGLESAGEARNKAIVLIDSLGRRDFPSVGELLDKS